MECFGTLGDFWRVQREPFPFTSACWDWLQLPDTWLWNRLSSSWKNWWMFYWIGMYRKVLPTEDTILSVQIAQFNLLKVHWSIDHKLKIIDKICNLSCTFSFHSGIVTHTLVSWYRLWIEVNSYLRCVLYIFHWKPWPHLVLYGSRTIKVWRGISGLSWLNICSHSMPNHKKNLL